VAEVTKETHCTTRHFLTKWWFRSIWNRRVHYSTQISRKWYHT